MFWQIVIAILLLGTGYLIGSFGLIQILIVLRFALPLVSKLSKAGVTTGISTMRKIYTVTLLLWSSVTAAAVVLVTLFATPIESYAFFGAVIICLLIGFSSTGANEANMDDFMKTFSKYACKNDDEVIVSILESALK